MGRGYVFGLLVGAVVSAAGLAGVSLMAPLAAMRSPEDGGGVTIPPAAGGLAPQAPVTEAPVTEAPVTQAPVTQAPVTEAPVTEPPAAEAPEAAASNPTVSESAAPATTGPAPAVMESAKPEAPAVPAGSGSDIAAAAPAPSSGAATAVRPAVPVVEVPPGSEFARPKPETDPLVPVAEPEPATSPLPTVIAPDAENAPALAEVEPARIPATAAAPEAPMPPEQSAPTADAALPAAEGSVPVPPPGEAAAPALVPGEVEEAPAAPAPATLAEAPATAEAPAAPATEPAAEPVPAPAAEPEAEPQPDAPAATGEPAFVDDAPGPPEEYLPDETLPEDVAPDATLPGSDGGPVIIGVAPRDPFGSADAPQPGFGQKIQPGFGQRIQPGFGQAGSGVRVNRPGASDGAAGQVPPAAETAPEADGGPAPSPAFVQPPAPVADGALRRHAAAFANPDMKPIVAVILTDLGDAAGGVAPDALDELGVAVTVAIDPEAPDAAARAVAYRLAGDEVAILAPDLPEGATASDLEVSHQGAVSALPEAVAVIGRPGSAFQTDRRIAQHLVSLLATEGRGIVTYTRGLDPARQAAEGEGLPHAAIFRDLDAEGENPATIQRYLDRAAFEAARTGAVVVTGTTSPGTVAALREWIQGGARGVVVGPVSAVMLAH